MDTNGHTILFEDYVSFEVAKLLKEKGFDEPVREHYYPNGFLSQLTTEWNNWNESDNISAPTHQMALKWLREVHGKNIIIEIVSDTDCLYRLWSFNVWDSNYAILWGMKKPKFEKYEQAVEAALKYTLENLI